MPFNETNDYAFSQWQEKKWHVTDNQQSPILLSGLLQSRWHCQLLCRGGMRTGSQRWGLPSAGSPWSHTSLHVQGVTDFGSHLWACSKRCLPRVLGEQGRREDVCVRRGNVASLRRVIVPEILMAAKSQENLIIKIGCLFLLDALLSPIHCILFSSLLYFCLLYVSFWCLPLCSSTSGLFFFFIYRCFFTHTCLYSFSFPKYFLFCLSCDLPYSLATFHMMEQRSWVVGWLRLASPLWTRLHLQSSGTDYMPELIKDAVETWVSGALARYPHIRVCACWCVRTFKMSVGCISSADWVLL